MFTNLKTWPSLADFNKLAAELGLTNFQKQKLTFVPSLKGKKRRDFDGGPYASIYELLVCRGGQVPTREGNWHDLCNFLTWCAFPKSKAMIHELGGREVEENLDPDAKTLPGCRTKLRDFLTRFDEGGCLLAARKRDVVAVAKHLEEIGWNGVPKFLPEWQVVPIVFGHAILESFLMKRYSFGATTFIMPMEDDFYSLSSDLRLLFIDQLLADGLKSHPEYAFPRAGLPMAEFETWGINT